MKASQLHLYNIISHSVFRIYRHMSATKTKQKKPKKMPYHKHKPCMHGRNIRTNSSNEHSMTND